MELIPRLPVFTLGQETVYLALSRFPASLKKTGSTVIKEGEKKAAVNPHLEATAQPGSPNLS